MRTCVEKREQTERRTNELKLSLMEVVAHINAVTVVSPQWSESRNEQWNFVSEFSNKVICQCVTSQIGGWLNKSVINENEPIRNVLLGSLIFGGTFQNASSLSTEFQNPVKCLKETDVEIRQEEPPCKQLAALTCKSKRPRPLFPFNLECYLKKRVCKLSRTAVINDKITSF